MLLLSERQRRIRHITSFGSVWYQNPIIHKQITHAGDAKHSEISAIFLCKLTTAGKEPNSTFCIDMTYRFSERVWGWKQPQADSYCQFIAYPELAYCFQNLQWNKMRSEWMHRNQRQNLEEDLPMFTLRSSWWISKMYFKECELYAKR